MGILCALPKELRVVWALFNETYDNPKNVLDDWYMFGKMEPHMVVAIYLSTYGTNEAAVVTSGIKYSFSL